jgi:hypothetical protein
MRIELENLMRDAEKARDAAATLHAEITRGWK